MSSSLLQGIYPQGRGKQKIHELGSELSIRERAFQPRQRETRGVVVQDRTESRTAPQGIAKTGSDNSLRKWSNQGL
jgi:hypothetical protein